MKIKEARFPNILPLAIKLHQGILAVQTFTF
jgi:hypothetical protein